MFLIINNSNILISTFEKEYFKSLKLLNENKDGFWGTGLKKGKAVELKKLLDTINKSFYIDDERFIYKFPFIYY